MSEEKKAYPTKRKRTAGYAKKVMIPKNMMMCKKELKYFIDNTWSAETMDTVAGSGPSLNANMLQVPSGTSYNTRTGFEIFVKNLRVKGYTQASTAINFDAWRIDFLLDRQPQVASGTAQQLWDTIYGAFYSTTQDYLNAFLDPHLRNRFKLIKTIRRTDEQALFSIATGAGAATPNAAQHFFDFTIPVNKKVRYISSSTGAPSAGWGDIIAIAWSTTDSDVPKVWMNTELEFYDAS